jgi:hypothetical protein
MKPIVVKALNKKRFDVLVALSKSPLADHICEEVAWFSNESETILGVIARHNLDGDFAAITLGRGEASRFEAFDIESSIETESAATEWIKRAIRWHTGQRTTLASSAESTEEPLDLFRPLVSADRLHPDFVRLSRDATLLPARQLIIEMMRHFTDIDGNFVEQFQTGGFDARLWELYLFVYLREADLFVDRSHPRPDFLVSAGESQAAIESVTAGRRPDRPPLYLKQFPMIRTPAEIREAHMDEIPLKFGSPLYTKLQKRYWDLPHVQGKPLVFAIADFHDDQSMLWTSSALIQYLYGVRQEFYHDENQQLIIVPEEIGTHKKGNKDIPSGFFNQPDVENVSAVLFSASATISKFNRIGRQAGFRSPNIIMVRAGKCHDHNPDASIPRPFKYIVDEKCNETWAEGLSLFHNPRATLQVPEHMFPTIAHHRFRDGQIHSHLPEFHPYSSLTYNIELK